MNNPQTPTWCPGCGTYLVTHALKKCLAELKIAPKNTVLCYDIGCSGNMINVLDVCGIETLHGRSIPLASGIKAVRPDLTVIAQAGDGGLLNEGLNHFIHAVQRNDKITLILNNNLVFGLTAGQQSAATPKGVRARATQTENHNTPLSAADLAAINGAKFIARIPESNMKLLYKALKQALSFDGFALVEIIQPCKIWAKDFPAQTFQEIVKPFSDPKKLLGKSDFVGILYNKN